MSTIATAPSGTDGATSASGTGKRESPVRQDQRRARQATIRCRVQVALLTAPQTCARNRCWPTPPPARFIPDRALSSPALEPVAVSRTPSKDWARLILLSLGALIVFRGVDTNLYRLLAPWSEALALFADLRLTSILVIVIAGWVTRPTVGWRVVLPDRRMATLAALWLAGAFAAVHFAGIGKVQLARWQDVVAFLMTGLIAEELLCRWLVFDAASRIWAVESPNRPSRAVLWSAAVFALMHLQHHGFRLDPQSWLQVAWTLPLGLLLGWITERTRSMVPAIALHFVNNLLVILA